VAHTNAEWELGMPPVPIATRRVTFPPWIRQFITLISCAVPHAKIADRITQFIIVPLMIRPDKTVSGPLSAAFQRQVVCREPDCIIPCPQNKVKKGFLLCVLHMEILAQSTGFKRAGAVFCYECKRSLDANRIIEK